MSEQTITTHSVQETYECARKIADHLKAGQVLCLQGELGSGKTTFVKGLAAQFGVDEEEIQSPTFTLIHEYKRNGFLPLYHMDCYRLEREEEALEIGMEDYFYGEGVSVVEWPEKVGSLIPEGAIWVRIDIKGQETRQFFISNFSSEFDNF